MTKHLFSTFFLIFGFFLLNVTTFLWYQRTSLHPITFEHKIEYLNNNSYYPKMLQIPSIGANLSVTPSIIKNNKWQTTGAGVSYLKTSPIPGSIGNSVMYGHNWKSILGDLQHVKPGDKVFVLFTNRLKREFVVTHTAIVDPNQASIIFPTKDTRLTIYTCTGFLDSMRFVVVAKPDS